MFIPELRVAAKRWVGASQCSIKGLGLNELTAHSYAVLLQRIKKG